ncbi:hypothetical protein SDC9_129431 [bioreactor metagenome]|uniref:Uncharacterized protein n=1 Tax=bioreactor metagenome TaxID=1076179 RepID=A0A645CYT0_9ZZZZ
MEHHAHGIDLAAQQRTPPLVFFEFAGHLQRLADRGGLIFFQRRLKHLGRHARTLLHLGGFALEPGLDVLHRQLDAAVDFTDLTADVQSDRDLDDDETRRPEQSAPDHIAERRPAGICRQQSDHQSQNKSQHRLQSPLFLFPLLLAVFFLEFGQTFFLFLILARQRGRRASAERIEAAHIAISGHAARRHAFAAGAAGHQRLHHAAFFHHFAHLGELADESGDLFQRQPGAAGDALAPREVDQIGVFRFRRGHRKHHRFEPLEFARIERRHGFGHLLAAGQEFHQAFKSAEAVELFDLAEEVIEVEFAFAQFGREPLGFFLVEVGRGLFHQRNHVAHAEDARCHAFREENIQIGDFFPGPDEFHRASGHLADRERRPAASVAVEFG